MAGRPRPPAVFARAPPTVLATPTRAPRLCCIRPPLTAAAKALLTLTVSATVLTRSPNPLCLYKIPPLLRRRCVAAGCRFSSGAVADISAEPVEDLQPIRRSALLEELRTRHLLKDSPKTPPTTSLDYLHRTGRTARMGAKGKVTSLVAKEDGDVGNVTCVCSMVSVNALLDRCQLEFILNNHRAWC